MVACRLTSLTGGGHVLAILGPWGSGKSTVLNFSLADLQQARPETLVIRFNPWWFSGHVNLTASFFAQLRSLLLSDRRKRFEAAAATIAEISEVVAPMPLPYAGNARLIGRVSRRASPPRNVSRLKTEVSAMFAEAGIPVLVVIDDLDRLPTGEILELFRLMKTSADLPMVDYLIATDRKVVVAALENFQAKVSGEEYLEKIVQVAFDLPLPAAGLLQQFFLDGLGPILGDLEPELFDRRHWGNVYLDGVDSFIRTPRHAVRLLNALRMTYPGVRGEVNGADFVGTETLRVFAPDLWDFIRRNQSAFANPAGAGAPLYQVAPVTSGADWSGRAGEDVRDASLRLVQRLFPRAQGVTHTAWSGPGWVETWEAERRVASPTAFPVYFGLAVPTSSLSRQDWLSLLERAAVDDGEFGRALVELDGQARAGEQTRARQALELLGRNVDLDLVRQRYRAMVHGLFDVGDQLIDAEDPDHYALMIPTESVLSSLIWRLTGIGSENEQVQLLREYSPLCSTSLAISVVGPLLDGDPEDIAVGLRAPLTPQTHHALLNLALERIQAAVSDGSLVYERQLPYILRLWMRWAGDGVVRTWVGEVVDDDDRFGALLERWVSSSFSFDASDKTGIRNRRLDPTLLWKLVDADQTCARADSLARRPPVSEARAEAITLLQRACNIRARGDDPGAIDSWSRQV